MPNIRPAADVNTALQRYQEGTSGAGDRWKDGVLNPRRDFVAEAVKAEPTWEKSMQAAISAKRFSKGMAKVDKGVFDATVNALGGAVYSAGVAAKMPKAAAAFARELPITKRVADEVRALDGSTPEARAERAKQFALRRGKASA